MFTDVFAGSSTLFITLGLLVFITRILVRLGTSNYWGAFPKDQHDTSSSSHLILSLCYATDDASELPTAAILLLGCLLVDGDFNGHLRWIGCWVGGICDCQWWILKEVGRSVAGHDFWPFGKHLLPMFSSPPVLSRARPTATLRLRSSRVDMTRYAFDRRRAQLSRL